MSANILAILAVALRRMLLLAVVFTVGTSAVPQPPNVILLMAGDMGWWQTGYYRHPLLKTPNLDAMAAAGLRLEQPVALFIQFMQRLQATDPLVDRDAVGGRGVEVLAVGAFGDCAS